MRRALGFDQFPTFCGVIIGGATLLRGPFYALLRGPTKYRRRSVRAQRLAHLCSSFLAALTAASFGFALLNKPRKPSHAGPTLNGSAPGPASRSQPAAPNGRGAVRKQVIAALPPLPEDALGADHPKGASSPLDISGRSLDLTLFSAVHAIDVLAVLIWLKTAPHGRFARVAASGATPALFAGSSATIMYAWFYKPNRLPRSYVEWISSAAELDERLRLALQHARYGEWLYGKDTGMGPLLGSLAGECGLPEEVGDPARTIPVSCEVVHMGASKSCEKHALLRFVKGFKFAAGMYLPLQGIILLKRWASLKSSEKRASAVRRALIDGARSSSFLGAFIGLFYYGVCLSRTRLGPKLFDSKTITPQMWDGGLCAAGGCALCGWSILLEESRKRMEMYFFVAPRAAAVLFPRRYHRKVCRRPRIVFPFGLKLPSHLDRFLLTLLTPAAPVERAPCIRAKYRRTSDRCEGTTRPGTGDLWQAAGRGGVMTKPAED